MGLFGSNSESVNTFLYTCYFGIVISSVITLILYLEGDTTTRIEQMTSGDHNPYREANEFINSLFFNFIALKFVLQMIIDKFGY